MVVNYFFVSLLETILTNSIVNSRKKILLTGASGTVGYEVLIKLFERRDLYDITVFDIKSTKTVKKFAKFENEIEIIYGDISNESDVKKICHNQEVVIHLAALIPPIADEKPNLAFKINTFGTENLIRNLEQYSPEAFFLYSSSISVYGDRLKNPMIKVTDPLIPSMGDEYAKTKIKAEEILQNCKLDWSIFRLGAIMGGHKISKLMFHQPLKTSFEIATAEDTGRAFVNAIENRDLLSKKIFNLGGGESCRTIYDKFLIRSFKIAGLGSFNFPLKTFAEKNFHCGYYEDGDKLENILHFRKDNLESYFEKEKNKIKGLEKLFVLVFKEQIKKYLLRQSEPYQAFRTNNKKMMELYFD